MYLNASCENKEKRISRAREDQNYQDSQMDPQAIKFLQDACYSTPKHEDFPDAKIKENESTDTFSNR